MEEIQWIEFHVVRRVVILLVKSSETVICLQEVGLSKGRRCLYPPFVSPMYCLLQRLRTAHRVKERKGTLFKCLVVLTPEH